MAYTWQLRNYWINAVISVHPEGIQDVKWKSRRLSWTIHPPTSGLTVIDPCSCSVPQLLYLLHQTLLSAIVYHCLPARPGVFLLVLLLSAGCCCLLRPATHAPLLFRPDTNLQTLLALRSNLSGQGISCPMCSGETVMEKYSSVTPHKKNKYLKCMLCPAGVFMEKPHPLYSHTSPSAFKFSTHQQTPSATTSTVPRSSVKTNSSTKQTGKTH